MSQTPPAINWTEAKADALNTRLLHAVQKTPFALSDDPDYAILEPIEANMRIVGVWQTSKYGPLAKIISPERVAMWHQLFGAHNFIGYFEIPFEDE